MREQLNFDRGWMFHRGDILTPYPKNKGASYDSAKTQRMLWGPASIGYHTGAYATEAWRSVDLPHDYIIEGTIDEANNDALGFFTYDNAWYRKTFFLGQEDKNRRLTLLFDGVATHATVYVNGCLLKHNFCGYTSFEVDITDVVKFGEQNTVAVYVNTQHHEGWWYEGGGIYRHVWLTKTDLISINLWGVYAKPIKQSDTTWQVVAQTEIRNDTMSKRRVTLKGELLDPCGTPVATAHVAALVDFKDTRTLTYTFMVPTPALWSPTTPVQYTLRTHVFRGKEEVDTLDTKFGFRTVVLDPQKGLFINGEHCQIKGLCGHADFGLSGKAVPDNIHRYKVALMKEMGANGYRTSHYPQAQELMDALDEAGFLVMDEIRWFESSDEGKAQLEMLMKRDRNRPSVMFWSIGNEEPHHATEEGRRIARSLAAYAKKLDSTRYIMTAVTHTPERATVFDELEVIGVNYNWGAYDAIHEKYPNKPVLSSENGACGTTRGYYFPDNPQRAFFSAYDHDINDLFRSREYTWRFICDRKWMAGGYQWIAFEHRGEATWPRVCSQSGAIDLFMQKKDAFYQNQSYWTTTPMVHLLPHWNWQGREGEPIKVFAYSNVSKLELFLNGKSQGVIHLSPIDHGEWVVPYEAGTLEVLAYEGERVVARDKRVTSGAPAKLMLQLENDDIHANGTDLAVVTCYVVDKEGNPVYDATCEVTFDTNGLGRIYSTGSDITDHTSLFLPTRKMRAGRIGVAVKVGNVAGALQVYASSSPLASACLTVNLTK